MKKKILVLAIAVALIAVAAIGGSLAWLTSTAEATNTFTVGDVDITLTESKWTDESNKKIVPGAVIDKDPVVNVTADSETCYVYLKVDVPSTFLWKETGATEDSGVTIDWADGTEANQWTLVNHTGNSFLYRYNSVVAANASTSALFNTVTFDGDTFTDDKMDIIAAATDKSIEVYAFAIQSENIDRADADTEATTYFATID